MKEDAKNKIYPKIFGHGVAASAPTQAMSQVTHILDRVQQGDPKAAEELLPLVYEELRKLAAHKMSHEGAGHTLQPTALALLEKKS